MAGIHPDIDVSGLETYLASVIDVDIVDLAVLHDGINLAVEVQTIDEKSYVLRRPNAVRHSSLFNDIEQEYRVMERLQRTAIPVPKPLHYCDDASIVGDSFLVMTALDGEPVRMGDDLPERFQNPTARERIGHLLIDTLADLHALNIANFDDICDRQSLPEQVAFDVDRFHAAARSLDRDFPRLRRVATWLQNNVPSESPLALCHGDYRPSNVLFTGDNEPVLSGVLDWETAFLGDPLTELGYLFLRWRDESDLRLSLQGIEERYPDHGALPDLHRVNEDGLSPFSSKPGSPSRQELSARYKERTGRSFQEESFYVAFSAFALATVWIDIHRNRIQTGKPSDREPWIEYMGLVARHEIEDDGVG